MLNADPSETNILEAEAVQVGCVSTSNADDVTVTVTSAAPPASETSTVAEFLSAVVPWPGPDDPPGHHIGVHIQRQDRSDPTKLSLSGNAICRSVTELIQAAQRNENWADCKGQFFCTTMQSKTKVNKRGNPYAGRSAADAIAAKSIFIDIDLDPADPKRYPDARTAWAAIQAVIATGALPMPSAVVVSGHGMHFYWISKVGLSMPEWHEYASGLKNMMLAQGIKFDPVVTGDAARVLRIPGTTNRKPGKTPVVSSLMPLPAMKLYDFPTTFGDLRKIATPAPAVKLHSVFAPEWSLSVQRVHPLLAELNPKEDDLGAGIDKRADYLVPATPVIQQCGFYKEAFVSKGANNDQPQWNLAILGTTFMENGRAIAHTISAGHEDYTPDGTDEMFSRKLAERDRIGLGWPSCAAIAGAGCTSCKKCPLFAKGKSPLNIRLAVTATVTNTSSPSGPSGQAIWTGQSGISFANIPHRKWLYGFDLVRGELTVIGSPGGAGKSSLAIGMAICVATNRELLGEKIRGGNTLKALIINAEDSTVELRRRTHAFCLAHNVAEHDLHGLTIVGADDAWVQRISFLRTNEKGMSALNQDGLDALQLALDALHPDVIVLDPLVSFCAGGNMNDNAVMSSVMRKLKEIAARHECAVLIVHHTRKGGDAGNVETISGAAAITNLARRAIMPAPLTDDDVKRFAILPSERFQYFKLVDAKSNLAPRATDSPLYRLQSVELPNPEPPLYPNGDSVQAITRVVLPIQPSGVASADDMKIEAAILEVVYRGKEIDGQAYPYSPSLAGANNQRALLPDAMVAVENATAPRRWHPGDLNAVTNAAIKKMKADGRLAVEAMKDLVSNPGRFRKATGLKAVPI